VRAGSVGGGRRLGTAGDEEPEASEDRGEDGHGWRPRPRGDGAAAVLEVVEVGGDAGGVDGPTELKRHVGGGEGEPVKVRAEQPVVDRAAHSGNRASWRPLSGATSVGTLSSSPGSQSAIPKPTGRSMVRHTRPLRTSDRRSPGLAKLAQVEDGWFALALQPADAEGPAARTGP
jgi:hypothetical protein